MEQVRRDGGFPAESATAMGTDSSSLAIALPERKSLAITKEASNGEGKSKQGNNYTTDAPAGSSLEGARFYIMLGTTTLAVLLVALNATIIGTATPSITSEFHTVEDVGWYAAAYLIGTCAMYPLMGTLYRLFNIKIMFLAMIAIFEVGSAVAGSATSSKILIVGRVISGIGNSGIVSGMMTIFAVTIPLSKRALINGIAMGCLTVGQTIGPVIGGLLADFASWRWCFYINLPLGGVIIIFFTLFVKLPITHLTSSNATFLQKIMTIDFAGLFLFVAACVMLLLGLEWGGTTYPWNSATVIGLLCGGIGGFASLVGWFLHKDDSALIPPRLTRSRTNTALILTAFVQGGGVFTAAYWLPIWFQGVKGASPIISGVMILPTALSQLVSSVTCGVLVQRWGYYLPEVLAGNLMVAVGAGLMSTFQPDTTEGEWIGYQILLVAGRGFALQLGRRFPLPAAIQTNLPPEDASIGSSTIMFSQYFGGAIFASIAKTVFTSSIGPAVEKYAPGLDPFVLINNGVTDLRDVVPAEELTGALLAYNNSLDYVFDVQLASACAAVVTGVFVGWKKISPKKKAQGMPDHNDAEKVKITSTAGNNVALSTSSDSPRTEVHLEDSS